MKKILKEMGILILIITAIVLVLGVLLYDYIPTSKVVPTTIAYQTPENLKSEIEEELIDSESQVIITYEIDKADLNAYQNVSSYKPGKQNPFSAYTEQTTTSDQSNTNGNGTTTGTSNTGNTVSDEEFFNNNKTK